jgi:hypothetical protein
LVGKHLSICGGKKPLRIPRNAAIHKKSMVDGQSGGASIVVSWLSQNIHDNYLMKHNHNNRSSRIKRQISSNQEISIEKQNNSKRVKHSKDHSFLEEDVKSGVDDDLLTFPEDKKLTSDFAYYTVLQLKKCYLTKAGGSRSNCPVGYPGLACGYCAGYPNERRFFYTSADHLRNSFSHIPSHLMICSHCPDDVKEKLEEYKSIRNKQKRRNI